MSNKILYIGSGTHLEPITHFPETKEFIFVDGQPRTEFGCDYYYRGFYRKYFFLQLENKIKQLGLQITHRKLLSNKYEEINVPNLESECLFITNKKYKLRSSPNIKYYISTSLPYDLYDNYDLQSDIETCDSLLICGYHPKRTIIKYIKKPINLIGYSNTYFPTSIESLAKEDHDYEENIITWIIQNPHFIKSYIAVDSETGERNYYSNYMDFYSGLQKKEMVNVI
jgi:hypothetical protein